MSLFIGGLAFTDPLLIEEAKPGTFAGSIFAAIAGFLLLCFTPPAPDHAYEEGEQAREIDTDGDVSRCRGVTMSHADKTNARNGQAADSAKAFSLRLWPIDLAHCVRKGAEIWLRSSAVKQSAQP